ncbi:MAG: RHS repeat-associated core domain-containing protein [Candidatus Sumerlaeia bacterium]|nr:RHS repeat-associated core domain-containing protein [Candidatus Sumerlaeia bacterium]
MPFAPLRAYRPDLGRWISRDPIQEAGGPNLYAYADNNPVNFTDPLGLFTVWNPLTWGDPWVNMNHALTGGANAFACLGEGAEDGYIGYSTGVFSVLGAEDYSDPTNMGQQWGNAFGSATMQVEKFLAEWAVIGFGIGKAINVGLGPATGRIFYSGGTSWKVAQSGAFKGYRALEQTPIGSALNSVTQTLNRTIGKDYTSKLTGWAWKGLSRQWAKGAKSNEVIAIINQPKATSIWNVIEKPILQAQGAKIIYY